MTITKRTAENIQAGIIKPHGRNHLCVNFMRFKKGKPKEIARFIENLGRKQVFSHAKQVRDSISRKSDPNHQEVAVISLGLSSACYEKLNGDKEGETEENEGPGDTAFRYGMFSRRREMGLYYSWRPRLDFYENSVEENYQIDACAAKEATHIPIDAVLCVAHNDPEVAISTAKDLLNPAGDCLRSCFIEQGNLRRRSHDRRVVSPLGYVDGLSSEGNFADRISTALVRENWINQTSLTRGYPEAYGSYMAYMKFKVNEPVFEKRMKELGNELETNLEDPSLLAKAYYMGRFPDGTPLALSGEPLDEALYRSGKEELPFDYSDDQAGNKCPFGAHIRRVNPRTGGNAPLLRRSYSYGEAGEKEDGLLFMSFQKSLDAQLMPLLSGRETGKHEDVLLYTQSTGSMKDPGRQTYYPKRYGSSARTKKGFVNLTDGKEEVITFRGGEFFFFPSLFFLRNLTRLYNLG